MHCRKHVTIALYDLNVEEFITDSAVDYAAYGLAEADNRLQTSLFGNGGQATSIVVFGNLIPDSDNLIYAAIRGERSVFAVTADIVDILSIGAKSLHSKQVYFMPEDKIQSIRLGNTKVSLELHKEDGNWFVREPYRSAADEEQIQNLISSLNNLPVLALAGEESRTISQRLFDAPEFFAHLDTDPVSTNMPVTGLTDKTITGRFLAIVTQPESDGQLIGKFQNSDTIYEFNSTISNLFALNPNNFREKTVLNINPGTLSRITVDLSGTQHSAEWNVERKVWTLLTPQNKTADARTITQILNSVSNLKAIRFVNHDNKGQNKFGFEQPKAILTLWMRDGEGLQKKIILGDISEELGVFATIQGQDSVFVIDKSLLDTISNGLAQ